MCTPNLLVMRGCAGKVSARGHVSKDDDCDARSKVRLARQPSFSDAQRNRADLLFGQTA